MVGWYHRVDGHEFALGVGDGRGSQACCPPWGHKELDMTERLNSKGRNGKDLTVAEEIKKRWQKYTDITKVLMTQIIMMVWSLT